MKWLRNVTLSRRALFRNKARAALAVLGTGFGVAAVLATLAVGEGAKREVVSRVQAMGRNLLVVNATAPERRGGRGRASTSTVETLKMGDARAIVAQSESALRVAPSQDQTKRITYLDRATGATVRGTTPEYQLIRGFSTASGRFFSAEENRAGFRVAVLGSQVALRLFPDSDPTGQIVRIGRVPFEISGVLSAKGVTVDGAAEEDNQVIVPITTALRRLFNIDYLRTIYIEVTDGVLLDDAAAEVAGILRRRHRVTRRGRPDDFVIQNQRVVMQVELATVASFRTMITGMGAVALLMGGIGIFSVMLLSVRERRSEIGLRVAVGARRRDVRLQFLIEAVVLGCAGGALGLLLGVAASLFVSASTRWTAFITPQSVAAALTAALAAALVAGVYPAVRAASWDPIDAMRSSS